MIDLDPSIQAGSLLGFACSMLGNRRETSPKWWFDGDLQYHDTSKTSPSNLSYSSLGGSSFAGAG